LQQCTSRQRPFLDTLKRKTYYSSPELNTYMFAEEILLTPAKSTPLLPLQQWLVGLKVLRPFGVHVILLAPLLLASALFLQNVPLTTRSAFTLGGVGPPTSQGFHPAETSTDGYSFRWTKADASIAIPPLGSSAHVVHITLSAPRPEPVDSQITATLGLNGQLLTEALLDGARRRYSLLIPADQLSYTDNRLFLQSPTFTPTERNAGERQLGVAVFAIDWQVLEHPHWLVPLQSVLISCAAGFFYLMLLLNRVPLWPRLALLVLFVAIMLAMRHSDMRFIYRYHALLMTSGLIVVLALACWLSMRPVPAEQRLALRNWIAQHWLALAGHSAITLLMLAPLLTKIDTHIMGPPGDNWEYLWKMDWFQTALVEQNRSPVYVPQAFYPGGIDLTYSEIAPAHTLLYSPLTALFGATISYNISIIASFILSAFFTYLLAHRLGAKRGAAWVAGLIFAFAVRRYHHAFGHFGYIGSQWLPLLLYGWEGLLRHRRLWDGTVAGVGYSLMAWSSLIYGTTAPFFVLLYTLVRLGLRGFAMIPALWRPLLLMSTISLTLVVPLAQPYLELQLQQGGIQHPYSELVANAIPPFAYFLPNPFHPLWGAWAQQAYPSEPGEYYGSIGYTALGLALVGLWVGRHRREIWALAGAVLCFMVLSFGPELRLSAQLALPLPARWLYEYAPVFGSIRTWGRMLMYVLVGVAVFAALGLNVLPQRRYQAAWLLAGCLVLVESVSAFPLSSLQARPVDRWLREQPGTGSVVHLPHHGTGPNEFYTLLFSDKPVSQGHGKILPAVYREGIQLLERFPAESALRLMQRWQTDYLVIDIRAMDQQQPGWQAEIDPHPLLRQVYNDGQYQVYWLIRVR
jgi:hypothetical protein